jgi:hypothetical protein
MGRCDAAQDKPLLQWCALSESVDQEPLTYDFRRSPTLIAPYAEEKSAVTSSRFQMALRA